MTRVLKVVILFLVTGLGGGYLMSPVQAGEVPPVTAKQVTGQRIILLAPSAPIILDINLLVDQSDFRSISNDYIDRMFASLDRDEDGYLDLKELKYLPAFGIQRYDKGNLQARLKQLDTDLDQRLSLKEFAVYLHSGQGSAFRVAGVPSRSSQMIELFRKLDQNQNGTLSDSELEASPQTLFQFDRDEDDVLNLTELRPFNSSQTNNAAQSPFRQTEIETAFLRLDHDRSVNKAIDEILKKYIEYTNPEKDAISVGCFQQDRQDSEQVHDSDQNADGFLNREELFAYLQNPLVDVQLQVSIPREETFRPHLKFLNKTTSRVTEVQVISSSKIEFHIDGLLLELRVKSTRHLLANNVRFYQSRFRVVDSDKNGYLTEAEFMQLNLPGGDYKKVDKNKDEMLFVEELTEFLIKDTSEVQNQVVMTVANDGRSLFEILDTDQDRRLSPRELRNSVQRVKEYDGNRDQALDHSELKGHFKITFELGKPELFVFAPRTDAMSMQQNMTIPRTMNGPRWFQRMDRNRDGDLSPREFLFEQSLFKKYDTNQDQLISPAEAEAVGVSGNNN
ncbi:MAG: EF-hand domain-containing protein [Planctomycetaceae bacterium]|nr:EF-hand domain-containing protein [Planctomycetaceae bacterium]